MAGSFTRLSSAGVRAALEASSSETETVTLDDIPPSAFTASSASSPPSFGRIHFPLAAWVAKASRSGEYLQVSLHSKHDRRGTQYTVTAVAIQGHPLEQWWVKLLRVEYADPLGIGNKEWKTATVCGKETLVGCADSHGIVEHQFHPPIVASVLRFVALDWHGRVALRVGFQCTKSMASDECSVAHLERLQTDLRPLVNEDAFADVAIVVRAMDERRTLLAHKNILFARSRYFSRAIKEAERQQGYPKVVHLAIDNVVPAGNASAEASCELACEVVVGVLSYLYAAVLPDTPYMLFAVGRLAGNLEIPELAQACTKRLVAAARSPASCIESFKVADSEGRDDIKATALNCIVQNWEQLTVEWDTLSPQQILHIVSAVDGRAATPRAPHGTTTFP